jgi:MFS family permease
MVGSNLLSGAAQLAAGTLLLAGKAQLWELAALAAVNGASSAFFFPASTGVIPHTVPEPMLQQANALLRLSINATNIVGASLGGILVAATSPGVAIVADGASFLLAVGFVGAMRIPHIPRGAATSVLHDLRAGWGEFRSRTWLWAIVLQFSVVNAASSGTTSVLGPAVAKAHFGGAAWWGAALTAQSLGLVLCGALMLRWKPRRYLRVATLAIFPLALLPLALARPLPALVVVGAAFLAGFFVEIFGVLWDTAYQLEIPRDRLSRVAAYDALGSWVLMPIGLVAVGPIAEAAGTRPTLLGAAALIVVPTALALLSREVRTLARPGSSP